MRLVVIVNAIGFSVAFLQVNFSGLVMYNVLIDFKNRYALLGCLDDNPKGLLQEDGKLPRIELFIEIALSYE